MSCHRFSFSFQGIEGPGRFDSRSHPRQWVGSPSMSFCRIFPFPSGFAPLAHIFPVQHSTRADRLNQRRVFVFFQALIPPRPLLATASAAIIRFLSIQPVSIVPSDGHFKGPSPGPRRPHGPLVILHPHVSRFCTLLLRSSKF